MKNLKKALCLVIVFVIMLSSLEVFAETQYFNPYEYMDSIFQFDVGEFVDNKKTEDTGTTVSEYDEYINLLKAFGIWDESDKSANALLTKTEFNVMVARARLGVDNPLENVYVKEASDDLVTYSEVLKFLLEGLGYYHQCGEFNYTDEALLVVSTRIKLIDKDTEIADVNESIKRGEFAKILCTALQTDLCEKQYTYGGYSYVVAENKNLLNSIHGIYDVSGFVNAVPGIAVYGNGDVRDSYFEINRVELFAGEVNVRDYFAKQVNAYAKKDAVTGMYSLIYITENTEFSSLEIDFSDITDIDSLYLRYSDENEEEQEINISTLKNIIQNGDKLAKLTDMVPYSSNDGKIILTSTEDEEVYDIAVIWDYTFFQVQSNSKINNRIYIGRNLKYNNLPYVEMDDKNTIIVYIDDIKSDWQTVPIGASVRMVRSSDGKYTEIYAYTKNSVSGTVSESYDNTVKIGNKYYEISQDLLSYMELCKNDLTITGSDRLESITVGSTGTFYTFKNYVIGFSVTGDYSYAFLRSVRLEKTSIDPGASLRMFTQDNEWQIYELNDKLILDGKPGVKDSDVVELVKANPEIINELIRYQINSENKIIALDTIVNSAYEVNDITRIKHDYSFSGKLDWTKSYLGSSIKYRIEEQTMWFKIPEDLSDEDLYQVTNTGTIPTNTAINLELYSADDFYISRIGIAPGGVSGTPTGNLTFVYIEKITSILLDPETEKIGYKIQCSEFKNLRSRANGTIRDRTFTVSEATYRSMDLKVGDFIKLTENATVLEGGQTVLRDAKVLPTDDVIDTATSSYMGYGTITKIDYLNAYILIECVNNGEVKEIVSIPRAKGHINTQTHTVENLEISDLNVGDRICFFDLSGNTSWLFTSN